MKGKPTWYILVALLAIAITIAAAGYVVFARGHGDARATINQTLTGMNLTYYSIAGKPMNYTIAPGDIVSIEPTLYEGRDAWKVRVGQGLAWDLTMDADGRSILYTDQLFRT